MKKRIPKGLDQALGYNVDRLASHFRRHLVWALREHDLTPEQWQVLAALIELGEPLTQMELSEVTLRDRHTLSRMLDCLEENGWIKRAPDPEDKRAFRITPTARAAKEFPRVRSELIAAFEPVYAVLTLSESAELLKQIRKLRSAFEK